VSAPAFSVWVTGPEQGAVEAIAEELARRLAARRMAVEVLDRRTPGIDALAGEGLERRAAFVAGLLARHGVAAVVALPVAARAARERVRTELGRMIEVYARPAHQAPDTTYEPPERPEVEITLPEPSPGAGVEQVLRTLEVLELLPRDEDRAYSDEEEREVIRRLKAFGYL
jgi:adenylylsulfate kinase-like enzyme